MRHLFSCFLLLIASYGCTSYRFAAIGENNDYVPKKKYRISTLTIHAPRGPKILQQLSGGNPFVAPDPWSIPQVASISNIEKLRLMVSKRHPSIFTQDESATPIDVNVYCTDERKELEWTILVPYVASLGVLPAFIRTMSTCEVSVHHAGAIPKIQRNAAMRLQSDAKLTCFSPLGLIQFDRDVNATSQRLSSGIMTASHLDSNTLNDLLTVFSESVADAIVAQVEMLEKKD